MNVAYKAWQKIDQEQQTKKSENQPLSAEDHKTYTNAVKNLFTSIEKKTGESLKEEIQTTLGIKTEETGFFSVLQSSQIQAIYEKYSGKTQ